MDNAQKAIMIGVGLFITIIIIAAVMLITGMGQDMLNSGAKQITELSDNLSRQLYNDYHGREDLSGSEVISIIKTNYNKGTSGITMTVINSTGSHSSSSSSMTISSKSGNLGQLSSFVKSNATYSCSVTISDNVVTGMTFTKN